MKTLMVVRRMLGALLPAPLRARWRRWRRVKWEGDFADWAAARAVCTGYDSPVILARVLAAARCVRDDKWAAERDGVRLADAPENKPLQAAMQLAAQAPGGRLSVLDFGGALGCNFWPLRRQLEVQNARWAVVEQPHFVAAGRREFQNDQLRFCASVEECFAQDTPNLLLLLSVLPYLPNPHALLDEVLARGIPVVMIDRTGFVDQPTDRLTIQRVPRNIYPASYPCWFFNRERFLAHFAAQYRLRDEWTNPDGEGSGFVFKGLLFDRVPG